MKSRSDRRFKLNKLALKEALELSSSSSGTQLYSPKALVFKNEAEVVCLKYNA